jgi:two-component system uhpT operon response regulator UhpA
LIGGGNIVVPLSLPGFVRVAMVDDHESVLLGLRAACLERGFEVVAVAATVTELVRQIDGRPVDVIVLDLSLGDGSSVSQNVTGALATGAAVLAHSVADRTSLIREAFAAGAAGVIPKSAPMTTVMAGGVLNNLDWASALDADAEFSQVKLTVREREVLHLYAAGLPLKLVALEMNIAVTTAREYLDRVRAKYVEVGRAAPTKVDLLKRAVEDGILALGPTGAA